MSVSPGVGLTDKLSAELITNHVLGRSFHFFTNWPAGVVEAL